MDALLRSPLWLWLFIWQQILWSWWASLQHPLISQACHERPSQGPSKENTLGLCHSPQSTRLVAQVEKWEDIRFMQMSSHVLDVSSFLWKRRVAWGGFEDDQSGSVPTGAPRVPLDKSQGWFRTHPHLQVRAHCGHLFPALCASTCLWFIICGGGSIYTPANTVNQVPASLCSSPLELGPTAILSWGCGLISKVWVRSSHSLREGNGN